MLLIPEGHHLKFSEYLCEQAHEIYVPSGSGEKGVCFYCGRENWLNGDFCIFVKKFDHRCSREEKETT